MYILIKLPNWLGDCIMLSPTISFIHRLYPEAKFVLIGNALSASVFKENDFILKAFVDSTKDSNIADNIKKENVSLKSETTRGSKISPKKSFFDKGIFRFYKRVKATNNLAYEVNLYLKNNGIGAFDYAITTQNNFFSALLISKIFTKKSIGYGDKNIFGLRKFLITHIIKYKNHGSPIATHQVLSYMNLALPLVPQTLWTTEGRMQNGEENPSKGRLRDDITSKGQWVGDRKKSKEKDDCISQKNSIKEDSIKEDSIKEDSKTPAGKLQGLKSDDSKTQNLANQIESKREYPNYSLATPFIDEQYLESFKNHPRYNKHASLIQNILYTQARELTLFRESKRSPLVNDAESSHPFTAQFSNTAPAKQTDSTLTLESKKYHSHTKKPDNKIIALSPGASFGESKMWPSQYFIELVIELVKRGYKIRIYGGKNELTKNNHICESAIKVAAEFAKNLGDDKRERHAKEYFTKEHHTKECSTKKYWGKKYLEEKYLREKIQNLTGKTSIQSLINSLRECHFFIGNDSGITHIARALCLPSIIIYGPMPLSWCTPWEPIRLDFMSKMQNLDSKNAESHLLTTRSNNSDFILNGVRKEGEFYYVDNVVALQKDLPCVPCKKRVCPLKHHNCMRLITPDVILDIINKMAHEQTLSPTRYP